ncbi:MAG TPA: xanthine dehydrogenase family protein subunit M, partial [Caldilineaceae bacterium]|nr:xanthine dehydrogenase family protein subunit M [Caldilineaceae bacterium]
LLTEHGYDAKPLAGGQSLIPTMNFRLAQPAVLVDLNNLPDLVYIEPTADGGLRIGAMTRQRAIERSPLVAERAPLLHATMPHIAHTQIRNRGTIGGSLAHADPAAELPVIAVTLGAQLKIQSSVGERWVAAEDFYIGLFTTDMQPEEIVAEVVLSRVAPRSGWAFHEIARRHGDYAIVGVAAHVQLDDAGRCQQAKIGLLSVGEGPVQAHGAMALLQGEMPSPDLITAAAEQCATQDIDPTADIHASVAFRRHLAKVLTTRALIEAFERAERA